MNTTHNAARTATRIHPLVALAAGSVILVSLVGTAAIAGLLPNSKATPAEPATQAPVATLSPAAPVTVANAVGQQYALVPVQAAPVVLQTAAAPAPVIKKVVYHPRPVQRHDTQVAHYDDRGRDYADQRRDVDNHPVYSEPVRAPQAQPVNYLGVGAGALIGGLVGNQVGGGNGKKLATVAGLIGGGFLGNEIANRNGYGR